MPFTVKVRETGKIFEALYEVGVNGQTWLAHTLEDSMSYSGYLYDTQPTNDPNVFNCVALADRKEQTFKGSQLERLPGSVKLRDRRKRNNSDEPR